MRRANLAETVREKLPRFGILVAKTEELAAVWGVFPPVEEPHMPGRGANRRYSFAQIPAKNGGFHLIVCGILADMGTNSAAVAATRMCDHFHSIEIVFMVGIAAGIPCPSQPSNHVRLGDIVVSNQYGVIQHDSVKETSEGIIMRSPPRPPSPLMLEAARLLEAAAFAGSRPWERILDEASQKANVRRPPDAADVLGSNLNPSVAIPHPHDPDRRDGWPRVFLGCIASGNVLLKNPFRRDNLRERFGVRAIEMEGAGIADAAWTLNAQYFIVRAVSDYADGNKNDVWQPYASFAAAAYTRALLESTPAVSSARKRPRLAITALAFSIATVIIAQRSFRATPSNVVHSTAPQSPAASLTEQPNVYISSDVLPVEIYIDGRYRKSLQYGASSMSIELAAGEHLLAAKGHGFTYEELIIVRSSDDRRLVWIPASATHGQGSRTLATQ